MNDSNDADPARGAPPPVDAKSRLLQLEKAVATMQVGVTITDLEGRIVYVNPAEATMHGYTSDELLGKPGSVFAPPHLRQPRGRPRPKLELREVRSWRRESLNLRKDGTTFPVEILSDAVLDERGEPLGLVSISQDISERKAAERALRESEERYALAVRGANDGIWDWNLRTGKIYLSERWGEMLGYDPAEIGDTREDWWEKIHPEDRDRVEAALEGHLSGGEDHFRAEYRMLHADGSYRWSLTRGLAERDDAGKAVRIAGSQTDITDRQGLDPLTGLPNRALFLDRLASALGRSRRKPDLMTGVLFLDLDRFKFVNDSLGHLVGDQLLKRVASTLESCLRPGDTVARLGGDEFTILVEEIHSAENAIQVAERVHARLEEPIVLADHEMFMTVSIGIALASEGTEKPENLLRDADTAMYRAKSLGRGRHQLFDSDMRHRAVAQLQVETDLRRAVERNELVVYYQPIVSLADDGITGFEALTRWNHPERGLIMPLEFISVAEETGIITQIGRWVLEQACRQLAEWQREMPEVAKLSMSVNLSPKQLLKREMVDQVGAVLRVTGIEPQRLILEITEGAFIENPKTALEIIEELREMGVKVCVDDFGTGYSSLSYLHTLPVNTLKIDRSFVTKLGRRKKQTELVQNIIKMAEDLGIDVVAEGVETEDQRERLRKLECGYMQGFSFCRPLEPERIGELLRGRLSERRD